jgi:hypothetical protein
MAGSGPNAISPQEILTTHTTRVSESHYQTLVNEGKILPGDTFGTIQQKILNSLLEADYTASTPVSGTEATFSYAPPAGDPYNSFNTFSTSGSAGTGSGQFWGYLSGSVNFNGRPSTPDAGDAGFLTHNYGHNLGVIFFTGSGTLPYSSSFTDTIGGLASNDGGAGYMNHKGIYYPKNSWGFSGSFSGSIDLPTDTPTYSEVIFAGDPNQPTNSKAYHGLLGDVQNLGGFGTVETGTTASNFAGGVTLPYGPFNAKMISGSFPSNYWTSSNVTRADISNFGGDYSGSYTNGPYASYGHKSPSGSITGSWNTDSRFTGSIIVTSGSLYGCNFSTVAPSVISGSALGSGSGDDDHSKYQALRATWQVTFGIGQIGSKTVAHTSSLEIQGAFNNSGSMKDDLSAPAYITSILQGLLFVWGGTIDSEGTSSVSCSVASPPNGAWTVRGGRRDADGIVQKSLQKSNIVENRTGLTSKYAIDQRKAEIAENRSPSDRQMNSNPLK